MSYPTLSISPTKKNSICRWCGRMVYLKDEDEKKDNFKSKIRSILNENSKYGVSTIQR